LFFTTTKMVITGGTFTAGFIKTDKDAPLVHNTNRRWYGYDRRFVLRTSVDIGVSSLLAVTMARHHRRILIQSNCRLVLRSSSNNHAAVQ
jgi:hypothetical protein